MDDGSSQSEENQISGDVDESHGISHADAAVVRASSSQAVGKDPTFCQYPKHEGVRSRAGMGMTPSMVEEIFVCWDVELPVGAGVCHICQWKHVKEVRTFVLNLVKESNRPVTELALACVVPKDNHEGSLVSLSQCQDVNISLQSDEENEDWISENKDYDLSEGSVIGYRLGIFDTELLSRTFVCARHRKHYGRAFLRDVASCSHPMHSGSHPMWGGMNISVAHEIQVGWKLNVPPESGICMNCLVHHHQAFVLKFWPELTAKQRERLTGSNRQIKAHLTPNCLVCARSRSGQDGHSGVCVRCLPCKPSETCSVCQDWPDVLWDRFKPAEILYDSSGTASISTSSAMTDDVTEDMSQMESIESSRAASSTKSKVSSRAASSTKSKVSTQAASSTKSKVSTRATSSTKSKASSRAASSTKSKASSRAASSTKSKVSTRAASSTKSKASSRAASSTKSKASTRAASSTKSKASSRAASSTERNVSSQTAISTERNASLNANTPIIQPGGSSVVGTPIIQPGASLNSGTPIIRPGASLNSGMPIIQPGASLNAGTPIILPGASLNAGTPIILPGASLNTGTPIMRRGTGLNAGLPIIQPGASLNAGTPIILPVASLNAGTPIMRRGTGLNAGLPIIQPGASLDAGTPVIQPGASLNAGTPIIRPGASLNAGMPIIRPGASLNAGMPIIRPSASLNAGMPIIQPGASLNAGTPIIRPGASLNAGMPIIQPGASLNAGTPIIQPGANAGTQIIQLDASTIAGNSIVQLGSSSVAGARIISLGTGYTVSNPITQPGSSSLTSALILPEAIAGTQNIQHGYIAHMFSLPTAYSDKASRQNIQSGVSDIAGAQIIQPGASDIAGAQIIQSGVSDIAGAQIIQPGASDIAGLQNIQLDSSDITGLQNIQPGASDVSGLQNILPDSSDITGVQNIELGASDIVGLQNIWPGASDTAGLENIQPDASDIAGVQNVQPTESDITGVQNIQPTESDITGVQNKQPAVSDMSLVPGSCSNYIVIKPEGSLAPGDVSIIHQSESGRNMERTPQALEQLPLSDFSPTLVRSGNDPSSDLKNTSLSSQSSAPCRNLSGSPASIHTTSSANKSAFVGNKRSRTRQFVDLTDEVSSLPSGVNDTNQVVANHNEDEPPESSIFRFHKHGKTILNAMANDNITMLGLRKKTSDSHPDGTVKYAFQCNFCVALVSSIESLLNHIQRHVFVCEVCSFPSFLRSKIIGHCLTKHPNIQYNTENFDEIALDDYHIQ